MNDFCLFHLQGLLQECNKLGAQYLFQTDKPYDVSYDTGDKSIQCGRHVDVFKLWLMWKAKVYFKVQLKPQCWCGCGCVCDSVSNITSLT